MLTFEWDEEKDQINRSKHGIALQRGAAIFLDDNRLTKIDHRFDYQEVRYITLGLVENRVYVAVYTMRGDAIRLISVRKANKREKAQYGNC